MTASSWSVAVLLRRAAGLVVERPRPPRDVFGVKAAAAARTRAIDWQRIALRGGDVADLCRLGIRHMMSSVS